ncbi:alpha/beta fold hydrolase [Sphingomonas sp. MMS24-J13]|uniref:alpha/beta fold hydrolase n=1 Tax=Sphingomonas sp. MMS24-J13 TaxID=3238686 RepID=UPI00385035CB
MPYRDRYWQAADGLALHARHYSAADGRARLPVICLHGLTRNARDFEALAPWLAARQRAVLAVDVRGRGLSDWDPRADYRLPTYADDIARLMEALGIAHAIFVGTSMGGLITMELAAMRPDLIAGAVINDVGPVLAPAGLMRIGSYVGQKPDVKNWADAVAYVRWQNGHALPHYGQADWEKMARRLFRERDGRVAPDYDPDISKPFADAPLAVDPWERWDALAGGRPILLLRGGESDLLAADVAAKMIGGHAGAALRLVPGVGHAPMLDEPEALAALEAFLDSVP